MNICVILPAAGRGERFSVAESGNSGGGVRASASKIEFELDHKPVFLHAIETFRAVGQVGQIILAVHPDRLEDFRFRWEEKLEFLQADLVAGGTVERWETVKLALRAVRDGATHVAIHDAARPVVSEAMINRVFAAAERMPAVIPGLPVTNTLKKVGDVSPLSGVAASDPLDAILDEDASSAVSARPVIGTVPREGLVAVQTPQVFEVELLRRAYDQIDRASAVTDDAGLVEALGEAVYVVDGDPGNIKITHPGDVELASALLAFRKQAEAEKKVADLFGDDDD